MSYFLIILYGEGHTNYCQWRPILYLGYLLSIFFSILFFKVSKGAKIRNRYNQVPHLTQDTNGKVKNSQLDTTNESQEVSPFPAGDHKAHINRRWSRLITSDPQGDTLTFSHICKLSSFFWVQNFEFLFFGGISDKWIFFWLWRFCGYFLGSSQTWTFRCHFYAF